MPTNQLNKVFITPRVFTAFIDKVDPKHAESAAYFRYFAEKEFRIYTDFITLNEAYRKIYEDITPSLAKNFLKSMTLGNINFVYPEESDIRRAVKALTTTRLINFTFQQALTAVLAEKRGINHICALDPFQTLFGIKIFTLPV